MSVNVTVEEIATCRKTIKIQVPVEDVNAALNKVTDEFQKFATIPGFRVGKAPKGVIERKYEKEIDEELRRKLVNESYENALKEQNLHVVGHPDIKEVQVKRNEPLNLEVTVDVAPSFTLPEYKGISLNRDKTTPTDEDVTKSINAILEQHADFKDVTGRPVQMGDYIIVDYTGTIDGKPVVELAPNAGMLSENKGFWLLMGEESFVPGFCQPLVGAQIDDNKEVTVKFKDDFGQKEVAGKEAVFQVQIKGVKAKDVPAFDDQFAGKIVPDKTAAELRDIIQKDLERRNELQADSKLREEVIQELLKKTDFDLPQRLVESETRQAIMKMVSNNQQRGVPDTMIEENKGEIFETANKDAKDRLKSIFILIKIAEIEKIEVTQDEIATHVQMLSDKFGMPLQKVVEKLREHDQIKGIYEEILFGKTLDFLVLNANVQKV